MTTWSHILLPHAAQMELMFAAEESRRLRLIGMAKWTRPVDAAIKLIKKRWPEYFTEEANDA